MYKALAAKYVVEFENIEMFRLRVIREKKEKIKQERKAKFKAKM
jgi:hypothetical protein